MASTLIVFQIILAIVISILVLLQKSSSIGLGAYSGSNDSLFGAKGPVSFLQKATFGAGLLLVINTLTLVYIYNSQKTESALDKVNIKKIEKTIPKSEIPSAPVK